MAALSSHDVANPDHYRLLKPEPINVIEGWGCNFRVGNAVAYLARLDRKGGPIDAITDIKKAIWYLSRELCAREAALAAALEAADDGVKTFARCTPT